MRFTCRLDWDFIGLAVGVYRSFEWLEPSYGVLVHVGPFIFRLATR